MSFQWTFLATFLYCELFVVAILLIPFLSPTTWQKFFKSRLAKGFTAGGKYYFNFIIGIFGLLFADSIRELRKHAGYDHKDLITPHAEVHANMKQFRSQRNFYIAGFALFLWFVIKRLITLLSECAREKADSTAARKQAQGVHRHVEDLMSKDSAASGDTSRVIDSKEREAEVQKYKQEAMKANDEIEILREQYNMSIAEFDKLNEEHRKLQNKMAVLVANESPKDK